MSLEDAMNNLATAMNRYADTMDRISNSNPTQIAVAAGGSTEAAPAADKGKPGRKKKEDTAEAAPAAAAAEPDPFADDAGEEEEAAPELTAEVIRGLVMKVKDKNKDHALALLKKVGAETVSKIDPAQYPKVVELAAKVGVTL